MYLNIMSSSAIIATTSEVKSENLVNIVSEGSRNINTEVPMIVSSPEESDVSDEEYWDELDEYYGDEICVNNTRLPRQGHELKHGKLIEKRGSSQEKFISSRPKALVQYGKQHFTASADDIDEEAKMIIREFVEHHGYFRFIDINAIILSGERSVLVHVPGRVDEKTGQREEYLIKVYRLQYGVNRGYGWALKEYQNMYTMWKYANVPNVYCPTKNVGIMRFVGDDGIPAPNLTEVQFEITEKMYSDVITIMHKLYNEGKIVHGKLSAKTILWWRDKIWLISLSHAVLTSDPKALQMLMKDCCHVTHFFKTKGLLKVKSIMNLFKYITGLDVVDDTVLHVLRNTRKSVKHRQKRRKPQDI